MPTISYRGSTAELRGTLRNLPAILAGRQHDPTGVVYGLMLRLGMAVLSRIQANFIVKARGGTGDDGITWQPLSPYTIAKRRQSKEDKRRVKQRTSELTAAQKKAMKKDEEKRYAELLLRGMRPDNARSLARAQAFNKARGAGQQIPTRLQLLGFRDVEILRDTGLLLQSLTPGVPGAVDGQVFRVEPGAVTVGSNRKTAVHHWGIPARNVPARPFWPVDGSLPEAWRQDLYDVLKRGIAEMIARLES